MRVGFRAFYEAYLHFSEDDGWAIASHIALSLLTSMFPFLIFVTALAAFLGTDDLADEAVADLFETWPKEVAAPLAQEIREVLTQTRGGLLTLGGVLSVYFAASGIEALRIALNRAYSVKETRPWWLLRLESIAYVLVAAFALLTWALLVVLAPLTWALVLRVLPHLEALDRLVTISRYAIATGVLLVALFTLHKLLPAGRRSLGEVAPGVFFTFVLWAASGMAFGAYLAEFARNYATTYAGLASVMIALVFLYMLAAIFIFGGELNAAITRARRDRSTSED